MLCKKLGEQTYSSNHNLFELLLTTQHQFIHIHLKHVYKYQIFHIHVSNPWKYIIKFIVQFKRVNMEWKKHYNMVGHTRRLYPSS
jgi:hypothetical protein